MSDQTRVPGASRENAILLLAAASELDLEPGVVQTTSDNAFLVPAEVADKAGFDTESGLPVKKAAKDAAKATEDSSDPNYRDFPDTTEPTLTPQELDERAKAAASAEGQEGKASAAKKTAAKKAAAKKATPKAAPKTGTVAATEPTTSGS